MSFYDTLHKKNIIAKPGFNRWLVPPASIAIHLCIGSVYAWSMFNPALVKILGVVTSSGDDWNLGQVVWIFSVAIVSLGLAAAYAGKWLEFWAIALRKDSLASFFRLVFRKRVPRLK